VLRSVASVATRATAATTISTGSRSGSAARSGASQIIRRGMRRRAAIEPVIGHLKDDRRMPRNHLKVVTAIVSNAVPAPASTTSACSCVFWQPAITEQFMSYTAQP